MRGHTHCSTVRHIARVDWVTRYGYVPACSFAAAGDSSYSFNLKRMDSHGGWISNSLDFTHAGLCVDGTSGYHKVLLAGSMALGRCAGCGVAVPRGHFLIHWRHRAALLTNMPPA
jgi:hypothetical protein